MGSASLSYKGHRYPVEVVSPCVWLYHRFPLSFREVEELMLERGVTVSYETIRRWCAKFGQAYANALRRRQPVTSGTWTRSSSRSTDGCSTCGGPSTKTATSSTS
ncbi:transposase-like protein [Streptomyces achromogenes]|uniref:Transposase-like protein n=1 Tax=Streptomyces achromogenes TaxID=67255 RepID=A0ABU0QDS9_STRAH|nr:transposase-like protein [Streptomyces achromogenes]MDQ0688812.1 transposase-like protein [Streptomyces achromogenes]